jgi:hypothetical protein
MDLQDLLVSEDGRIDFSPKSGNTPSITTSSSLFAALWQSVNGEYCFHYSSKTHGDLVRQESLSSFFSGGKCS